MEHAATRHEAGVGGTHEAMGRGNSSSKAIFKITIDYDEAKAGEPRYVQVLGTGSLTGGTGTCKTYVRDLLLRGFGLGTVRELILLLVGAPTASPALILIGTFASDSHESRGRGDSLARLGGERPSTRPQGSGARGTAALRRGARATDRAAGGRWRGGRWGLRVRGDFAVCVQEVSGDGERTRDEEARGGVERHGGGGGNGARNKGVPPYVPNRVLGRCKGKRGVSRGIAGWMGHAPGVASEHLRWRKRSTRTRGLQPRPRDSAGSAGASCTPRTG